ncbi:MAG: MBL fold metallo-hydrolase [Alphaproteobacteria bacterium]|jgi:phosphoribosyl 1,2-cyclic phosphodiesterase|nr:MBL fold metallo-hydrolase [Alphaproteobacteria bacterium]
MRLRFWGTRGSLPVALGGDGVRDKVRAALRRAEGRSFPSEAALDAFIEGELDFATSHGYGGNSSCVEIIGGDNTVICDMGSGLRELGQQVMQDYGPGQPRRYDVFLSHVHWDHIMGLPFFAPAYIPGNEIHIHGCHTVMEDAFRRQQSDPCFPVHWEDMGAEFAFHQMQPGQKYRIAGFDIAAIKQNHPGDSYGYRLERNGKSAVYSTDGEHKQDSESETRQFVDFLAGADLLVFDAMYSLADMVSVKQDWGHSSNIVGVDLCHRAGVAHYCLFHHEPIYDDYDLQRIHQETRRYAEIMNQGQPLQVSMAYDGLEIEL